MTRGGRVSKQFLLKILPSYNIVCHCNWCMMLLSPSNPEDGNATYSKLTECVRHKRLYQYAIISNFSDRVINIVP
jgi:hypothetical protein